MRKFLTLLIILTFSALSFSQDPTIDSLIKVTKNTKIDRSEAYNLLYKKLKRINRDSVKTLYLDKAYQDAKKHNNQKELGATLNYAGYYYMLKSQLDTAKTILERALEIRLALEDTLGISKVYNNLATYHLGMSEYKEAVENVENAIEYRKLIDDPKGLGISYNALGNVYNKWGKNKEAIDNYMLALKNFELAGKMDGVSSCYNNIGLIYFTMAQGEDTVLYNKALEQFNKAIEINKKHEIIWELANNYRGVANVYAAKAEQYKEISDTITGNPEYKAYMNSIKNKYFEKAFEVSESSAEILSKIGNIPAEIESYIGIASILINRKEEGDIEKALEYFEKALPLSRQIGDDYLTTISLIYLGRAYVAINEGEKALEYLYEAEAIAKKKNLDSKLITIYEPISYAYDSLGNYKKSLDYFRIYHKQYLTDSQGETKKIIAELETKYESEKKDAAIEIANAKNEKQQLQSERQMLIIYGFIGVFVIVIIFSFIVFRQFKQIRKSNIVLSEQKSQIEEANEELNQQNEEIAAQRDEIQDQKDHIEHIHKEVSDSIHYAERIQKAILPKVDDIDDKITDRFTLFKPKDIVSGDFYWQKHIKHSNLFVATAADCTGHGVPGAFMSMLGIAFLNEIVNKSSITRTGQVLDNLRQSVISSLHQTGKAGEAQDGMDIAFIALDYETNMLQFSGANNPLYVIRSKDRPAIKCDKMEEGENHTLYEIKGDKMPIGIYKKELTDFKTNEIQLEKGDAVYMFSDGYADQFGGPKGKKLKYKPFKNLLLSNFDRPMQEQANILNRHFEEWRGDIDQIDDVIVMGIKI